MNDLTTILKAISPVKAGDDIDDVLTASRLNAIRDALYALAAGDNIKTSGGVSKRSFPTQVILRGAEAEAPLPVIPKRTPFEPYQSGFFESGYPKMFLAFGTVCRGDEKNTATPIVSGSLDDMFLMNPTTYPLCWLKCIFEADGSITHLSRETGTGWSGYPYSYSDGGGGAGSNTWYHPIARMREARTSKSTVNDLRENPFPDSGEEYFIGDGTLSPDTYTVVQLTNTHLVGQQQCMTDSYGVTRTAWKLVPGPGATTGTGS